MIKLLLCGLLFTGILLPNTTLETPTNNGVENSDKIFEEDTNDYGETEFDLYGIICPNEDCWS